MIYFDNESDITWYNIFKGDLTMVILTIIGTVLILLGIFVSLCTNISDYGESSEDVNEEDLPTYTYPIV